jgi:hypothetical protein
LLASGRVFAWGRNLYGQLGNGTTTNRTEPTEVKNLTGVSAIAAGFYHSLALRANGTVMAWGEDGWGELGNGWGNEAYVDDLPLEVAGINSIAGISAGFGFSLAFAASAPANTDAPTISGEPTDEKTLTASTGARSGFPGPTYTYQWLQQTWAASYA